MNQPSQNKFTGLWLDSHEADVDSTKLTYSLNSVRQTSSKNRFGYVNERGTELCATLPDGYKLRGYIHISERDEFIVFLFNGTNSEIGGVKLNDCSYKTYLNDKDIDCKLMFGFTEWIGSIEAKRIQPCNEIELYWSNNRIYRFLNIDSPHRPGEKLTCDDLRVFKADGTPIVESHVIKNGGYGVLNGTYQVVLRYTDEDSNHTNWFNIWKPVKIYGGDNKSGELSPQYIAYHVSGLSKRYTHVDVAIIKVIKDATTAHLIADKHPYNTNKLYFEYRGQGDELEDIPISEITTKNDYWISGKGLTQKDNRLILFDVDNHWNLNYQKQANEIQTEWTAYRIPVAECHKYPSLLGDEVYIPAIRWNYIDGTFSPDFPIINHNKSDGQIKDPCSDCIVPEWEVNNTSSILGTAKGYGDPYQESKDSEKIYKDYRPKVDFYKTVEDYAKDAKKEAKDTQDEVVKNLEKTLKDEDDIISTDSSCCDEPFLKATKPKDFLCEYIKCSPGCKCINGLCFNVLGLPCPFIVVKPTDGNDKGDTGSIGQEYTGSNNNEDDDNEDNDCETCCADCQGNEYNGIKTRSSGSPCNCPGCPCDTSGANGIDAQLSTRSSCEEKTACDDFGNTCGEGCICVLDPIFKNFDCSHSTDCTIGHGVYCHGISSSHRDYCACVEGEVEGEDRVCVQIKPFPKYCIKDPKGPDVPDDPGGGTVLNNDHDSNTRCTPVYDEDGCTIIDCIPKPVAWGKFGYWESKETYPITKDCNGDYIYGEFAGKPITGFRAPSRSLIPHFISYQTGVPNIIEPGNDVLDRGYVQVIGFRFSNIKPPANPPKPLDPVRPFEITYIKRDDGNKSILAKGMFMGTFEGEVYGDKTLFPRNGVNSLELFNRHIYASDNKDHAGYISETPGYTFHSPTTSFNKPFIGGYRVRLDLEIYGKGWRHGLYAEGAEPGTTDVTLKSGIKSILSGSFGNSVPKIGQKGTRSSIHLNKYDKPLEVDFCVKDASYVEADSILPKGPNFSKTFTNKDSESCVFIELNKKMKLKHGIDSFIDGQYNGSGNTTADQTADASFLGDAKYYSQPIYNAAAHYGGIYIKSPRQYGRLEKAPFISTGIFGNMTDLSNGTVHGWCGDVYVSPYSFTKSTNISNLVGDRVLMNDKLEYDTYVQNAENSPETAPGKNGGKAQKGASGLKKFFRNMVGADVIWTLCNCGNTPYSGLKIEVDPRNGAALRGFNNDPDGEPANKGGGFWDGKSSFQGKPDKIDPTTGNAKKAYYPGLQKTEIIYWVESEIAVPLRQTGEELNKEINYFNTKDFQLDSSFSGEKNWKDKYFNRFFYIEFPELSQGQKNSITFIIFAAKVLLPLYILLQLGAYLQAGGGLGGALLSLIIQIIILLLVILMIIVLFIVIKTFASPYLLQWLGLRQCYDDTQGGPGDSFKKDFKDNYSEYYWKYSMQNDLSLGFSPPSNYNVCDCVAEPTNKIIYSNPQIIDSPTNSWRNFKVNNVLQITNKYGKITDLIVQGNQMYAACTDMILDLRVGYSQLELNNEQIEIGRGDYINAAIPMIDGVPEGYGGVRYPNGAINTPYGYIFIDEEAGRIYSFNGGKLEEISNIGVRQFMKNNLKLKGDQEKYIVDQKYDKGIGYAIGYDYKFERILITKKDYEDGKDVSWTLSYDPAEKTWVSFHSYTPHLYMYNRFDIYTEHEGKLWKFNTGKKYQTYFNKYYPHIIEYSSRLEDGFFGLTHHHTILETEAINYIKDPNLLVRDLNITFNKALFYNSNQTTGIVNLSMNTVGENVLNSLKQDRDKITISRQSKNWKFSDIKDYAIDPNMPLISKDFTYKATPIKENIGNEYKHPYLEDKYLVTQLILDNKDDIELLSRGSFTVFNKPEE